MQVAGNRRPGKYLDKIILEFENINGTERVQVAFYDSMVNNAAEILDLDNRASDWERELAEMIDEDAKKIA